MQRSTRAWSNARFRSASCATGFPKSRLKSCNNLAELRPDVRALQRHREIGDDEAGRVTAIVANRRDLQRMEWLLADRPGHGVGQLDFAARALFARIERPHHLRLEDVAADHTEPRRRDRGI